MESLPEEIQNAIFCRANRADRKQLRLVSKGFADRLRPFVFDSVVFDAGDDNGDRLRLSIRAWSEHSLSSCARALRLRKSRPASLSPPQQQSGSFGPAADTADDAWLGQALARIHSFEYGADYLQLQGALSVYPRPPSPVYQLARHLSGRLQTMTLSDVHFGALTLGTQAFGPFPSLQEMHLRNVGSDDGEDMNQFFGRHTASLKRLYFYGCRLNLESSRRACRNLRAAGVLEYAACYSNYVAAPGLVTLQARTGLMHELFGEGVTGDPEDMADMQYQYSIEWRKPALLPGN